MDRNEAAAALASVEKAQRRGFTLHGYARTGSTVMLWGAIWLVCNLLTQFFPWGGQSWMVGVPIGTAWSVLHPLLLIEKQSVRSDPRIPLTIFVSFAFLGLVMAATGAHSGADMNVLISLLVAAAYLFAGIWAGARFALVGIVLTIVIVLGRFVFPEWLNLWLGIGGGGALIVAGFWLRRA